MTNEEFVSYEIAQALKKAGFDWPCSHYYTKENVKDKNVWLTFTLGAAEDFNRGNIVRRSLGIYSAPTLAQAQKWLREEKRWHVQVRINGIRDMFSVEIWEMKANGYCKRLEQSDGHVRLFDRYEDALSEGIGETLKLIEEGEE